MFDFTVLRHQTGCIVIVTNFNRHMFCGNNMKYKSGTDIRGTGNAIDLRSANTDLLSSRKWGAIFLVTCLVLDSLAVPVHASFFSLWLVMLRISDEGPLPEITLSHGVERG